MVNSARLFANIMLVIFGTFQGQTRCTLVALKDYLGGISHTRYSLLQVIFYQIIIIIFHGVAQKKKLTCPYSDVEVVVFLWLLCWSCYTVCDLRWRQLYSLNFASSPSQNQCDKNLAVVTTQHQLRNL